MIYKARAIQTFGKHIHFKPLRHRDAGNATTANETSYINLTSDKKIKKYPSANTDEQQSGKQCENTFSVHPLKFTAKGGKWITFCQQFQLWKKVREVNKV